MRSGIKAIALATVVTGAAVIVGAYGWNRWRPVAVNGDIHLKTDCRVAKDILSSVIMRGAIFDAQQKRYHTSVPEHDRQRMPACGRQALDALENFLAARDALLNSGADTNSDGTNSPATSWSLNSPNGRRTEALYERFASEADKIKFAIN